jgi:lipoprotein NlpI
MITIHRSGGARPWRVALACVAWCLMAAAAACDTTSREAAAFTSAGVTHLQQREYDRAIRDFDRALAIQPGLVVAWRQRGLTHIAKGDYDRAIADFDHAIVFAPNDARLLTDRGAAYALINEFSRALQDFDRAISIRPDQVTALEHRGRTHFILGNFAQAAADLQRGLNPADPDPYMALWLHLARRRLAQDDSSDFAAHAAAVDSTRWPAPVTRYFLGSLGADSLRKLAVAADTSAKTPECEAAFYLGEDALLRGRKDSARALFVESRDACPRELGEHKAAMAELRRLRR